MNTNSTSSNKIKINPNVKTAIIYSIENLYAYIIEIKEGNKHYYISSKGEPLKFGNMEEARGAILKENVKEAYLALSKTSVESDLSSAKINNYADSYDYSPIPLHPEN